MTRKNTKRWRQMTSRINWGRRPENIGAQAKIPIFHLVHQTLKRYRPACIGSTHALATKHCPARRRQLADDNHIESKYTKSNKSHISPQGMKKNIQVATSPHHPTIQRSTARLSASTHTDCLDTVPYPSHPHIQLAHQASSLTVLNSQLTPRPCPSSPWRHCAYTGRGIRRHRSR